MPEAPGHGLKADITVVADVVVQKYAENKPLYRQQRAFARIDIPLRRQNLCHWVGWCSDAVAPVATAMAEFIRAQPMIQSDEISVRMQLASGQMQTPGCGRTACRGRRSSVTVRWTRRDGMG